VVEPSLWWALPALLWLRLAKVSNEGPCLVRWFFAYSFRRLTFEPRHELRRCRNRWLLRLEREHRS